jgi:hypothetical protein
MAPVRICIIITYIYILNQFILLFLLELLLNGEGTIKAADGNGYDSTLLTSFSRL